MSFQRRQVSRTDITLVDGGVALSVPLSDGEGYYVLRRYMQRRVAGAAAANHRGSLHDADIAEDAGKFHQHDANHIVAEVDYWPDPDDTDLDGSPGRVFFAAGGRIDWLVNASAAGDTWQLVIIVERVR